MAWFQNVTVVLKFLPLLFVAVVGWFFVSKGNFGAFNASGGSLYSAIGIAAGVALFSFIGVEVAAVTAKRVKDPRRNVGRASLLGTAASAIVYLAASAAVMGLVAHNSLVNNGAPFVDAFQTVFSHGTWAGKLVAALAVVSGIGALNGWTLVTTEVSRAAANDGLFPKAFAWTDRKDSAWFGIVIAALLPSLLMLWRYTSSTGLTVFTELVDLTVVTVAIPYLFSACAQLTYLVSGRRRVQGWLLARDLTIAAAATLFSLWVTFAAGYSAVYQAMVVVLAGIILYAFLNARRERSRGSRRQQRRRRRSPDRGPWPGGRDMSFNVQSEVGQLRQVIVHRPGLELSRLTPQNIGGLLFDDVMWAKRAKEEHDVFAESLRERGVTVHYFGQLLAETLEVPAGREFVLDRMCTPEILGPELVRPLRRLADGLDAPAWPSTWSAACSRPTCGRCRRRSLKWDMLRADDFVLPRCPTTCSRGTTPAGSTAACRSIPMAKPARQRETLHMRAIYRYHPMFANADFITYYGDDDASHLPASVEGGDVHPIGHGTVLIGMGERTTPMAVEILARALFGSGQATPVIAVELPQSHAMMHLDTAMTMIDRDVSSSTLLRPAAALVDGHRR